MIFLTGDTRGDFRRLSTRTFPEQKHMTEEDYVIILRDIKDWNEGRIPIQVYRSSFIIQEQRNYSLNNQ